MNAASRTGLAAQRGAGRPGAAGWTTPYDLNRQLTRLWERGELLRPLVDGDARFPLRLTLKGPGTDDLTAHFEAVRAWVATLTAQPRLRIEWREVRHRVQGPQRLPGAVFIDSFDDALTWLAKHADAERFASIVAMTRTDCPALLPWLARRPLQAIELAEAWSRVLAVVRWIAAHPRPGIYLRQVDVPGVHTKFIEAHRSVLAELLDLVLPTDAIASAYTGATRFAARYGFRDKPAAIRFRVLDPRIAALPGTTCPDIVLDVENFARLDLPLRQVFITENETNFLAFPPTCDALVVFGAGYGWAALAQVQWLADCSVHYWGDIDTHGFAILDQLRGRFVQVSSFLMDRDTLMSHAAHWGEEPDPVGHDLPHLTASERALFDDLRDNRIRRHLRLEQERVGFTYLNAAVQRLER